ncbi:MAG: metal dependent phosphohydrolase [Candidatus Saccharibacteria bacterium]|nr:metal dependent phosphohydrolase [Candidatus Saccharibacteria bacterium]
MIPNADAIEALHHRYARNEAVFDLVYTHCGIVTEIALWCADRIAAPVDRELLIAGCMLHDIGTYALFDDSGHIENQHTYRQHAVFGAALVAEEGYDPRIVAMIRNHVQMGLSKQEIIDNQLALPHNDFQPQTLEERLVCYADRFHTKLPVFSSYETLLATMRERLSEQAVKFEAASKEFGIPDVPALAKKYGHPIR